MEGRPLARWSKNLIARVRALPFASKTLAAGVGVAALALAAWGGVESLRGPGPPELPVEGVALAGSPGSADTTGEPLADASASALATSASVAGVREQEVWLDRELAARAESLLARTAGDGRVVVRVRSELDWSRRDETQETFDPDGQVERKEERTTGSTARGAGAETAGSTERVEYDIGRHVTHTVTPAGAIRRLYVAVLVDGKPDPDGRTATGFTPWSAAELEQLEILAKQAVGFSGERGDVLTLTSVPFRRVAPGLLDPKRIALVVAVAEALLVLAALAGTGFVALRSLGRVPAVAGLPMSAAELEALLLGSGYGAGESDGLASGSLAQGIVTADVPAATGEAGAAAIRAWLKQE